MKAIYYAGNILKRMRHHFLLRAMHFLENVSTFFFLASMLTIALYILGNFQSFLENTQFSLLAIAQGLGIIGIVSGLYYFFSLSIGDIQGKHCLLNACCTQ